MKRSFLWAFILPLFLVSNFQSVAQRTCGAMDHMHAEEQTDPHISLVRQQIEAHTQAYVNSDEDSRVNGVITIPTVVHVIYNNNTENISDAQIQSQMQVLNEDFRRQNPDANNTWSQAADIEIEFCLATVDPNGNATNGITRTSSSVSAFGTNDQMKFNSSGGKDAWPAGQYLNMWVCDISGGILGYAQFPGGSAATDGVVMDHQYFGTIGTATAPFDGGRTTTHEVGHWLNLRHIWGDGNCNADDFVSDTPTSDAANYGCATNHVSCSSTDMVQNYMDYSDDACMNLFTQGQKTRMRALFDSGGFRESLLSSPGCSGGADPTCDDGFQNGNETGVDCGGPDCPACPTCFDNIQNGDETGVDCGGSCAAACPCNGTNITISITLDNYPEETSWSLTDATGTTILVGGTYDDQPDGNTISVNWCLSEGCYDFTINDAYGDGICCGYGNGSYSVVDENSNTLVSGGQFTFSETTNFCVGGPAPTCSDGMQNGNETGVDCGGPDCADCITCDDGILNGNETGVDCGGPDCAACPTCNDNIQNQGETGVDCGGPCAACPTCNDGIQNQGEDDVDCGGPCAACPTCNDGEQNQGETSVDCGGPCGPCAPCDAPTNVTALEDENGIITFTWSGNAAAYNAALLDASGSILASLNGFQQNSISTTNPLAECTEYGFEVQSVCGNDVSSVSSITYTTLGAACAAPTCDDGIQNGDEEGVDCGGGCIACITCDDNIQNGDETGVDCGGSNCPDCPTACSYVSISATESFETNYGIWNDGGSDCARPSYQAVASTGVRVARLRDNSNSSVLTTDNLDLAAYEEITVDFHYACRSMDNANEDFWLQVSTNGGGSWTTVEEWNLGDEFINWTTTNGAKYNESVVIPGPFTSSTKVRFRADASGNQDWVYLDDIAISGCLNAAKESPAVLNFNMEGNNIATANLSIGNLFPNPARDIVNVKYAVDVDSDVQFTITDLTGQVVYNNNVTVAAGKQTETIDVSRLGGGYYLLILQTGNERVVKKFVTMK